MVETDSELEAFAQRLNAACDAIGIPPKGKGRQNAVAQLFQVTQKGARKWLEGEAFPKHARLLEIAEKLGVNFEWLASGTGKRMPSREILSRENGEPEAPGEILAYAYGDRFTPMNDNVPAASFTPIFWSPLMEIGDRIGVGTYLVDAWQRRRLLALALSPEDLDRITGGNAARVRGELIGVFRSPYPFPLPPRVTLGYSVMTKEKTYEEAAAAALRRTAALCRPEGPEIIWLPWGAETAEARGCPGIDPE
ncbi:helix-turn-helix domain-containing protein [Thioalkalivibrio sp. ALE19]|uniref:helix-turn-helix domain-containing protein n=1 Tax=Thioalkalivibrio sp. ALE19 TaxID=1266909 RepID=UPI00041F24CF|nr:helix-turn-helix transcriptional regulator [Thioalkalivibrio sp. ALE19]